MKLNFDKILGYQIVLLTSNEQALCRQALKKILESALPSEDDLNYEMFNADTKPIEEWIAKVSAYPFLSERRVVVVRNLLRVSDPPEKQPLELPFPQSAFLLLVVDDEEGDEMKQKKLKTSGLKWQKWVTQCKGLVLNLDVHPKELRGLLTKEAEAHQKTITPAALEVLVEMSGNQVSYALGELQKLLLYIHDKPQIREQDVRELVVPQREWNIYKMMDAVFAGNSQEALKQLRTLMSSSSRAEEAVFLKILPSLSRQIKLIWQARLCVEAGVSPQGAPKEVSEDFLEKQGILSEPDWLITRLMHTARNISYEKLGECLRILADTDARLKGILPSCNLHEALEQMILKISYTVNEGYCTVTAKRST